MTASQGRVVPSLSYDREPRQRRNVREPLSALDLELESTKGFLTHLDRSYLLRVRLGREESVDARLHVELDALLLVIGHETFAELLAEDVLERVLLHTDDVEGS
jgi:hypothetical protein